MHEDNNHNDHSHSHSHNGYNNHSALHFSEGRGGEARRWRKVFGWGRHERGKGGSGSDEQECGC